jgi:hypothetical protein
MRATAYNGFGEYVMTTLLTTLRMFPARRLIQPRWLLVAGVLFGLLIAIRILRPAAPAQMLPGQTLAWDIVHAASRSADTLAASGAYLPGDRLLLYTRTGQTDRARVRAWARLQLEPFADRLAKMPGGEQLIWMIDFGPSPAEQEVLIAPLSRAADASLYRYVGGLPVLAGTAGGSAAATVPTAAATEQPVAAQPTALPAAAATSQPTAAVASQPTAAASQPTAAVASQPTAAASQPTAAAAQAGQPLLTSGFDETGGKSAWLPLSGTWETHDGIYS